MLRHALASLVLVACGSEASDGGVVTISPVDGGSTSPPPTTTPLDGGRAQRCLADPIAAVNALSATGVLLGYQLNGFFDPSTTKHWEGVARLRGGGGTYLAVSRIGPEMVDIVEMASRSPGGEAFGASRASESEAPPAQDKVIAKVDEDPGFEHAGGMQTFDDVLAVPLENGTASRIVFFDVASPKEPKRLGTLERPSIGAAGSAGMARRSDGRLLLVVGRKGDQILDFYVSKTNTFDAAGWDLTTTWSVKDDGVKTLLADGDTKFGDYQNLDVVPGCDGKLYLLGTHREGILVGQDFVDLYAVTLDTRATVTKVAKRHVFCAVGGKDAQCNLDAAAGAYITPSGMLHVYALEHDNDGPGGSIKMKEL